MPDESTYGFNIDDATSLLNVISSTESEISETRPSIQFSGVAYFFPPTGGIPAASWSSGTSTLTPGAALCYFAVETSGAFTQGTTTATVQNIVEVVVGSNLKPVAAARNAYGNWTVLVENCGASSSNSSTFPEQDGLTSVSSYQYLGLNIGI